MPLLAASPCKMAQMYHVVSVPGVTWSVQPVAPGSAKTPMQEAVAPPGVDVIRIRLTKLVTSAERAMFMTALHR
jgi:hypothetical protein